MGEDKNSKDSINQRTCINCGKPIPRLNEICYKCGFNQRTGELERGFNQRTGKLKRGFNFKRSLSFFTTSYGGLINKEGMRCVRCGSEENLQYFKRSTSVKKVNRGLPYKTTYRANPSFKFPVCEECAQKFRKWKRINLVFYAIIGIQVIIFLIYGYIFSIYVLENFIYLLYWLISIPIILVALIIFYANKNNPKKWMQIRGYFDTYNNKYNYNGYVYEPDSKEWFKFEEWLNMKKI